MSILNVWKNKSRINWHIIRKWSESHTDVMRENVFILHCTLHGFKGWVVFNGVHGSGGQKLRDERNSLSRFVICRSFNGERTHIHTMYNYNTHAHSLSLCTHSRHTLLHTPTAIKTQTQSNINLKRIFSPSENRFKNQHQYSCEKREI